MQFHLSSSLKKRLICSLSSFLIPPTLKIISETYSTQFEKECKFIFEERHHFLKTRLNFWWFLTFFLAISASFQEPQQKNLCTREFKICIIIAHKSKSLSVFHINACFLNKKFGNLEYLLKCTNKQVQVVAVTETRNSRNATL